MISLDQVYLLEQKVESAVEKIQQLQAENDALRSKCNELTNALSAKSEQLSNFESDQSQIESGKAPDRIFGKRNIYTGDHGTVWILKKARCTCVPRRSETCPISARA